MTGSITALVGLGLRNLRARPGLGAAVVIIASAVVALTAAVPLFARSVATELFVDRTGGIERAETRLAWNGSVHGPTSWERLDEVDGLLRSEAANGLSLPDARVRSLVDSVRLQVEADGGGESLGSTSLSWHDDLDLLLDVVEGSLPAADVALGQPVPVAIEEANAAALGATVGDRLTLTSRSLDGVELPVTVVALWRATPDDGWVTPPDRITDRFFTSRVVLETIFDVVPSDVAFVRSGRWSLSTSADGVSADRAEELAAESRSIVRRSTAVVPELENDAVLAEQLAGFVDDTASMRRQMAIVMAPLLIALFAFAALLGQQRAAARRREFDLWRLRGADDRQVGVVIAVESVLLGALAFVLGSAAAPLLTMGLASFDGFLDPSRRIGTVQLLSAPSLLTGAAATTLVVAALLLSVLRVRREIVVGAVVLSVGTLVIAAIALVAGASGSDRSGFRDPAPFVVPALMAAVVVGVLGWSLRPVARRLAGVVAGGRTAAQPVGLAVRRLGGRIGWVAAPAALLAVGLATALAAAAVGRSTDEHVRAEARHDVGADWSIQETLALRLPGDDGLRPAPVETQRWETIGGVDAATRVGTWTGSVGPPGRSSTEMTHLTLEPDTFASVAWWRDDYAPMALADLLGSMAAPDDVLVSRSSGLRVGDRAELRVFTGTETVTLDADVVGVVDRFPTWSPDDAPALVVGRIDRFDEILGEPRGHRTWVATDEALDFGAVARETTFVTSVEASGERIELRRSDPVRRGVYGVFSVATVALLGIGLFGAVVSAAFADGARSGERSLLRAIGFGPGALGRAASWEVGLVLVPAAIVGVGIATVFQTLLLGSLLDAGAGTPPLLLRPDVRLLPLFCVGLALSLAAIGALVQRRAARPIDASGFVDEGREVGR